MQATGSQSYIAICDETTYGVTPNTPTLQKLTAMVYGESLGASYEEVVSNSVNGTRAKSDVRNGNQTVSGRIPFELSIASLGKLFKHAIGTPTKTGSGPYVHTYKRGALPPGMSVQKWFADIAKGYNFTGCRVNSLALTIGNTGAVTGDIELMGQDMVPATAVLGTLADDIAHKQVLHCEAGVTIDGTAAALVSANLTITNGLDGQRAVGSRTLRSLREGVGEITGQLTMFFEGVTSANDVINETSRNVTITFTHADGSLEIELPATKFTGDPVAKIASDKGLTVVHNFRALLSAADQSDIVVTLTNGQETV